MRGAISMFRPMRRFKQALSPEECRAVLERGTSGVLALTGDGGWPYAVPLSYVYFCGSALHKDVHIPSHMLPQMDYPCGSNVLHPHTVREKSTKYTLEYPRRQDTMPHRVPVDGC